VHTGPDCHYYAPITKYVPYFVPCVIEQYEWTLGVCGHGRGMMRCEATLLVQLCLAAASGLLVNRQDNFHVGTLQAGGPRATKSWPCILFSYLIVIIVQQQLFSSWQTTRIRLDEHCVIKYFVFTYVLLETYPFICVRGWCNWLWMNTWAYYHM